MDNDGVSSNILYGFEEIFRWYKNYF
jgi:hypothetical protein